MKFEKVSWKQYSEDCKKDEFISNGVVYTHEDMSGKGNVKFDYKFKNLREYSPYEIYEDIKLPKRATKKSAGYDFFAPYDFVLAPGETIKIATGIRVILDDDKCLMCAPRSGHGFKARIQLDNTIGIIDADYSDSDNEGHIFLKLTNDSRTNKTINVFKGEGMMQGIIMKYYTVENDNSDRQRNGGFGSTNN